MKNIYKDLAIIYKILHYIYKFMKLIYNFSKDIYKVHNIDAIPNQKAPR